MQRDRAWTVLAALPFLLGIVWPTGEAHAWRMIAGNDAKVTWDDQGKPVLGEPGGDTVSIIEVGDDPDDPVHGRMRRAHPDLEVLAGARARSLAQHDLAPCRLRHGHAFGPMSGCRLLIG